MDKLRIIDYYLPIDSLLSYNLVYNRLIFAQKCLQYLDLRGCPQLKLKYFENHSIQLYSNCVFKCYCSSLEALSSFLNIKVLKRIVANLCPNLREMMLSNAPLTALDAPYNEKLTKVEESSSIISINIDNPKNLNPNDIRKIVYESNEQYIIRF
jgi:hypothetical protein